MRGRDVARTEARAQAQSEEPPLLQFHVQCRQVPASAAYSEIRDEHQQFL